MSSQAAYPASGSVFAKPKRPIEFHVPRLQGNVPGKASNKQRQYLQLKEKIMRTDELIQKYRQKAGECDGYKQQLKEVQTKLSIEEKSRKGLVAELGALHKENETLKREKESISSQAERLQLNVKDEELVRAQLMVQLNELKGQRDSSNQMKEELATTKTEMEKFKRMYQKLKQEFEVYKAEVKGGRVCTRRRRRTSEANSLPVPVVSPPLTDTVLSPMSTCSLPLPLSSVSVSLSAEPPSEQCQIIDRITNEPQVILQAQGESSGGFDPNAALSPMNPSDYGDQFDRDAFDVTLVTNGTVSDPIANSKNDGGVFRSEDGGNVSSVPNVVVTRLSDDSDSEDENTPSIDTTLRSHTCTTSEQNESTGLNMPSLDTNLNSHKFSEQDRSHLLNGKEKIALNSSITDSYLKQSSVLTDSCSREAGDVGEGSSSGVSDEQGGLVAELFGDFDDSLSHLSVSDSSSSCSRSSLGSVDDLGDLLRSSDQAEEGEVCDDKEEIERGDDKDLSSGGSLAPKREDKVVCANTEEERTVGDAPKEVPVHVRVLERTPLPVVEQNKEKLGRKLSSTEHNTRTDIGNDISPSKSFDTNSKHRTTTVVSDICRHAEAKFVNQGADSNKLQMPRLSQTVAPVEMVVTEKQQTAYDNSSSTVTVCDGPSSFLPRIEVEAAPADTASSEDSDYEMDVSFSTLFGDEFHAVSPLPPSPFQSQIQRVSAAPLSPLPPSPSRPEFLSPLPQTPPQDLEPISPLSCSPIEAHPPLISPLPQSPQRTLTLNEARRDIDGMDSGFSGGSREENDTSPVQFDDAVPIDVHIPKPCCLSISTTNSPEAVGPTGSSGPLVSPLCACSGSPTTSPINGKLCVSKSSPFSPLSFVLPVPTETTESESIDNSISDTLKTIPSSPLKPLPTCSSSANEISVPPPVFQAMPLPTCSMAEPGANSGGDSPSVADSDSNNTGCSDGDLASKVGPCCREDVGEAVVNNGEKTEGSEESDEQTKLQNESKVVTEKEKVEERKETGHSSEPDVELVDQVERRETLDGDTSKQLDVAVSVESDETRDEIELVDNGDKVSDRIAAQLEMNLQTNEMKEVTDLSDYVTKVPASAEKVEEDIEPTEISSKPIPDDHASDSITLVDEEKEAKGEKAEDKNSEKCLKDELTLITNDTKVSEDSCVPASDYPIEKIDGKAVPVGEAACSSSETHEHRSSPVEEGEICESDEDETNMASCDETNTATSPTVTTDLRDTVATNPNSLQSTALLSPQKVKIEVDCDSNACMSVEQHSAASSFQATLHTHNLPHSAVCFKPTGSPRKGDSVNVRGRYPRIKSPKSSSETFDDLLNSFCSKTKPANRGGPAKISVTHGSPGGPKPSLARLRSAARNKPKMVLTPPASKAGAAAIIGVERVASSGTAPLGECSGKNIGAGFPLKTQDEPKIDRQRKTARHLEKVMEGGESERVVPASKRVKVEELSTSVDTPSMVVEAQGKEAVNNGSLLVATPLVTPLATPAQCLPGYVKYQLRSREVRKVEVPTRKRRKSSSSSGGCEQPFKRNKTMSLSVDKNGAALNTEAEVGCKLETINSNSVCKMDTDNDNRVMVEKRSVDLREQDSNGSLPICGASTKHAMSATSLIDGVRQCSPSDSSQREIPSLLHEPGPVSTPATGGHSTCTSTATRNSPQPMTTSILADSCHMDSSSDAENDQPLVIGDLDSLLDDESNIDVQPTLPFSSAPVNSANVTKSKSHCRKTDSATGQEEDQTPASSPRTGADVMSKQILGLSEQKKVTVASSNVLPFSPSLSSAPSPSIAPPVPPPTVQSVASATNAGLVGVGYGQPQPAPLPKYKATPPSQGSKSNDNQGPSSSLSLIDDDDDVFHTPLPLLEKSQPVAPPPLTVRPPGPESGQSGLSLAQRQLTMCMQCPLPLPHWLVSAMMRTQSKHEHCAASGAGLSRKKRGSAKEPIKRQNMQKVADYVQINLERMVCGHLHLSAIIDMFSNRRNIPSLHEFVESTIMFLKTRYNPKTEHVISTFHALCDDVRGNPREVDPLDSGFPPALLRPECQMMALFLHLCQLSKHMAPLLVELNKALYQTLLQGPLKFHKLSALCRILTAICRLQGDSNRLLFLAFDLLKKPLQVNELPVITALASVWPTPLARKRGVKLLENRQIVLKGLEQQPMSYTLEALVMTMLGNMDGKLHGNLPANLLTLCQWSGGHQKRITSLTESLVKLLQTSDEVYVVSPPESVGTPGPTPWHRPRPSMLAFHIVHCLRMISHCQGWVWTNDTLIRAHLWPLLQQWNAKQDSVREATVVCTVRLIGFISQQGLSHDLSSSSLGQLQRVLVALLNKSDQLSFPVQLAAVDSLLELCPQGHPRSQELVGVVRAWLKKQAGKPHERFLFQEFSSRLQAFT